MKMETFYVIREIHTGMVHEDSSEINGLLTMPTEPNSRERFDFPEPKFGDSWHEHMFESYQAAKSFLEDHFAKQANPKYTDDPDRSTYTIVEVHWLNLNKKG